MIKEKQEKKEASIKDNPKATGSNAVASKKKEVARIEDKIEVSRTSPRSPAKTAIRRVIMPLIVLNPPKQKNYCSLGNFHADDCKYGG